MTHEELKRTINQATGTQPADFLIRNAKVLDVATGEIRLSDIGISRPSGMIVHAAPRAEHRKGLEVLDVEGQLFAVPGFIDCHVHVESSKVTPYVFEEAVAPRGTTTAFCDPHEYCNVLGRQALDYFTAAASGMVIDLMTGLSSCVPATALETSGARLLAEDLAAYIAHPKTYGLAEFMSVGDVLAHDERTLEKLERFRNDHIDGHMPFGVTPAMMDAMACCGIRNCHENTDLDHAREKLRRGFHVFIREGSVCKDAKILAALVNEFQSPFLGFCTDDRSPVDIAKDGHIDHVIRTLTGAGADPKVVYRIASWSAANHFGMAGRNAKGWMPRGLIAPGRAADIVLLRDLESCDIHSVYKKGALITPEIFRQRPALEPAGYGSIKIGEVSASDFRYPGPRENAPVIGLIPDQIVTTYEERTLPAGPDGAAAADPANDILYGAVIERHGRSAGNIGRSFVRGFGITEGAIASSVGHDSHNITVVGATHEDMALAVNRVIAMGGGMTAVKNGTVLGELPLPLAGLMSDKTDLAQIAADQSAFHNAVERLEASRPDPLMMTAFLSLAVIPDARVTDHGITRFNPAEGIAAPTLIMDQKKAGPSP